MVEQLQSESAALKQQCSELSDARTRTELAMEHAAHKNKQEEMTTLQEKESLGAAQAQIAQMLETKGEQDGQILVLRAELEQEKAAHAATSELVTTCEEKHNAWV